MKAFVSLHTAEPQGQIDHEVTYAGYRRLEVEYDGNMVGMALNLTFPIIQEDTDEVITHIAIGRAERGQGEVLMHIPSLPHIPIKAQKERLTRQFWLDNGAPETDINNLIEQYGYTAPKIAIDGTDIVQLPDNINPIARVAHQLVYAGLLRIDDLHPKLFEAINDALHNAGVPVFKVTRGGAAKMDVKMSQMPSLQQWGNA